MVTLYIPTALTLLRILLVPCLAWDIITLHTQRALILFIVAALTDFFDGFLARLWKTETKIGALLDPLADKILIISCYGALFFNQTTAIPIPAWFIVIITAKELLLVIGTLYGIINGKTIPIKPTPFGKAAMVLQVTFVSLVCFYTFKYPGSHLPFFSLWLYGIIGITLFSFIHYFYLNYQKIMQ